ncbi:MAG: hypothetical protein ACMV1K_01395 [Sulfurospirillum sp.]
MFNTVLGLFTGTQKWVYIALVICALGFAGMTKLSVELHADKAALQTTISDQNTTINERNALIDVQVKEVKRLSKDLAQTKADLQMQNALNEQYAVDMEKAKRTYEEAMAKKPPFRTQYVSAERTNDEAKDLHAFVKKWRTKP